MCVRGFAISRRRGLGATITLKFFSKLRGKRQEIVLSTIRRGGGKLLPIYFAFTRDPGRILKGSSGNTLVAARSGLGALRDLNVRRAFDPSFGGLVGVSTGSFIRGVVFNGLGTGFIIYNFGCHFKGGKRNSASLLGGLYSRGNARLGIVRPRHSSNSIISSALVHLLVDRKDVHHTGGLLYSRFNFSTVVARKGELNERLNAPAVGRGLPRGLTIPGCNICTSTIALRGKGICYNIAGVNMGPAIKKAALLDRA